MRSCKDRWSAEAVKIRKGQEGIFAFPGLCCDRWLLLPGLPCSLALCVDGWAALWVQSVGGKVKSRRHRCLLWDNRMQWRLKCLCPKSARFSGSCALRLEHSKGSKKPQYQSGLKCFCWVLLTVTFWQLFIFSIAVNLFVYWVGGAHAVTCMWGSEDNLGGWCSPSWEPWGLNPGKLNQWLTALFKGTPFHDLEVTPEASPCQHPPTPKSATLGE